MAKDIEVLKLAEFAKQEAELAKGSYVYVPKTVADGVSYTVHEYTTPTKEKGFQITYFDGVMTKSEGKGPESASRTWDWKDDSVKDINYGK